MRARALLLAVAVLLAPGAYAKEPAPSKALADFFERQFELRLKENPESATLLGIEGYDDKLTDYSPAAVARRKSLVKQAIAELARFDPGKLNTQDRISRDNMLFDLRLVEQENAFYGALPFGSTGDGWLPVSSMHGPQQFFASVSYTHLTLPTIYSV